jgi:hypothetical protein
MFEEKNEKKIEARNGQIGLVWFGSWLQNAHA